MSDTLTHKQIEKDTIAPIPWPERWVKKRFAISMLVLLFAWPLSWVLWTVFPGLESIVANGLLLDSYYQLAYLTVTNVVAFYFAFSILRLLNARNPGGIITKWIAGDGDVPWYQRSGHCRNGYWT